MYISELDINDIILGQRNNTFYVLLKYLHIIILAHSRNIEEIQLSPKTVMTLNTNIVIILRFEFTVLKV